MLKWERRSLARSIVGLFVWMTTVANMPLLSMRLLFGENYLGSYRDIWRIKFPTGWRAIGHFKDARRVCYCLCLIGTLLRLGWVGEEVADEDGNEEL
jgi:hypothetical protein